QIKQQAELLRQKEREEFNLAQRLERMRAAEALRESRERLEMVVESIHLGLWYWDVPANRLVWNDRSREQFGVPPGAEVNADLFFERLHPEDRSRVRKAIDDAVKNRSLYDTMFRTLSPAGE